MKIWTDDECIEVDPDNVGELEAAMRFKAEHIKAKADPELFTAVADMLDELWNVAIRWADVVRCVNCIHWVTDDLGNHVCEVFDIANSYGEPVATKHDDFCSYGEKKEEA